MCGAITNSQKYNSQSRINFRIILSLLILFFAATMWSSTTKAESCWINEGFNLNFGYIGSTQQTTSSSLPVTCDNYSGKTQYIRICLAIDNNAGMPDQVNPRKIISWWPEDQRDYDLFADSSYSQIIGTTTSNHSVYSMVMTHRLNGQFTIRFPIYGLFYGGQKVLATNYEGQLKPRIKYVFNSSRIPDENECVTSGGENYATVKATYYNGCYMNGAYTLSFGNVSNLNRNVESNTAMWLWCPSGISWQVGLDNGQNALGTQRRMTNGSDYVNYDLYLDAGYSRRWGNSLNTDTMSGSANGELQYLNIYGKVPVQTNKSAGSYSDTVVITLTY